MRLPQLIVVLATSLLSCSSLRREQIIEDRFALEKIVRRWMLVKQPKVDSVQNGRHNHVYSQAMMLPTNKCFDSAFLTSKGITDIYVDDSNTLEIVFAEYGFPKRHLPTLLYSMKGRAITAEDSAKASFLLRLDDRWWYYERILSLAN